MIGSLLFVADCYLYVLSFVQVSNDDDGGSDRATSDTDTNEFDRKFVLPRWHTAPQHWISLPILLLACCFRYIPALLEEISMSPLGDSAGSV